MTDLYQFVDACPVIPVIVIDRLDTAIPLAEALVAGGITTLEVTLRTAHGLQAIRDIAKHVPNAFVGAGTVCNAEQFQAVVDAGARFVVSPGSSEALFNASRDSNIPLLPGAVTATEVMAVANAGFPIAKFFPAGTSGGAPAIKALSGPFPYMRFIPTGGVSLDNMGDYLSLGNISAVGGSWLTPKDAIERGDYDRLEQLARDAVTRAHEVQGEKV